MVVDYRALNKVTERRFFIIPNSDGIKASVAGSRYVSVGDLKEGFNQCENEDETAQKMAVIVASGSYLPRGLTFGPTNGPEDFQELVFIIFGRRLYRDWFLFLDDLAVATGRRKCLVDGPSCAEDVVEAGFLPVLEADEREPAVDTYLRQLLEKAERRERSKKYLCASSTSTSMALQTSPRAPSIVSPLPMLQHDGKKEGVGAPPGRCQGRLQETSEGKGARYSLRAPVVYASVISYVSSHCGLQSKQRWTIDLGSCCIQGSHGGSLMPWMVQCSAMASMFLEVAPALFLGILRSVKSATIPACWAIGTTIIIGVAQHVGGRGDRRLHCRRHLWPRGGRLARRWWPTLRGLCR